MKIKYICPFWGQESKSPTEFVNKAVEAGYNGVEVNVPDDKAFNKELLQQVEANNLKFVTQLWMMPLDEPPQTYAKKLETELLRRVDLNPAFINSHTGRDFYSFDDNCRIIEMCLKITQKTGIEIIHETHRGRFPFCAKTTFKFLNKFPELSLNADFSHWVLVSESFLEDQKDALDLAIEHSQYMHARVGHIQTPQVNHPFVPENAEYLQIFLKWWKEIIERAKMEQKEEFLVCPEFGPAPYMPAIPFTQQPVSSQWEINKLMMEFLRKELL